MEQFVTKQEQKLYNALNKLLYNCIDMMGNAKKPTFKQLISAKKALTNYEKYEKEHNERLK